MLIWGWRWAHSFGEHWCALWKSQRSKSQKQPCHEGPLKTHPHRPVTIWVCCTWLGTLATTEERIMFENYFRVSMRHQSYLTATQLKNFPEFLRTFALAEKSWWKWKWNINELWRSKNRAWLVFGDSSHAQFKRSFSCVFLQKLFVGAESVDDSEALFDLRLNSHNSSTNLSSKAKYSGGSPSWQNKKNIRLTNLSSQRKRYRARLHPRMHNACEWIE